MYIHSEDLPCQARLVIIQSPLHRRAVNLAKLELFLAAFEIAPFDATAVATYGSLRAQLQVRGTPLRPLDTLITAHALALSATMITNNVREFGRVPSLTVENWLNSL